MKKQFFRRVVLLIVTFISAAAFSQSVVTFQDNYFRVNGQFFFPIGWYGTHGTTELAEIRSFGANVVLLYLNAVIDCYHPNGNNCQVSNLDYDNPNVYIEALIPYLQAAASNNLMVFIQLPTRNISGTALLPNSFLETVVQNTTIRNHPALLGWYQADEPEGDSLVGLTYLQTRYNDIRGAYTGGQQPHPVFVVFAQSHGFGLTFPTTTTQKFYDVLMADNYPMAKNDPIPSPGLNVTRFQSQMLDSLWGVDTKNTATSGSMMFVGQGYGENNASSQKNIFGLQDNFNDGNADGWATVTGSWSVINNQYAQTNIVNSNTNVVHEIIAFFICVDRYSHSG